MNIEARIKELRLFLDLNQTDFGSRINVGQSAIGLYEKGKRTVSDRVILDICREFNVNEEWLRYGNGDMFTEPDTFSLDEYAKQRGCTDLQIELVKSLLDLDVDTVRKLMNAFKPAYDKLAEEEITATMETANELSIKEETENYRKELKAMQKGVTSSVLDIGKENIS